jgi:hypothetical protein
VLDIGTISIWGIANPRAFNVLVKVYENRDEEVKVRIAALDGILETNPQWMPNIPGTEILEESVSQLVTLFDQTATNGKEFIDQSMRTEAAREIGERLNARGGGFDGASSSSLSMQC